MKSNEKKMRAFYSEIDKIFEQKKKKVVCWTMQINDIKEMKYSEFNQNAECVFY